MSPLVLVLAALLVAQNVKLPAFLVKHPPTAELVAAQKAEKDAREKLALAEAQLKAAEQDRQAKKDQLVSYSHQMTTGALIVLERAKPEEMTEDLRLATGLVRRANNGLEAYEGRLSAEQLKEIQQLVADAVSALKSQRDAALAALASKDADLTVLTKEKSILEAKIPALQASLVVAEAATTVAASKHEVLEKEVIVYADKADMEKTRAGTAEAFIQRWIRLAAIAAVVAGALYYFAHFLMPSLAQEHRDSVFLKKINDNVRSLTSSHE